MHPLIGNARPEAESLNAMRERQRENTRWAAYQNVDLGSSQLGHLKLIRVGAGCTLAEAPEQLPDFPNAVNWRYKLVGYVNLDTGGIDVE